MSQVISELENDLNNRKMKTATHSLSNLLHNIFSVASVQTDHCAQGHLLTKPSSTYIVDIDCSSRSFLLSLEDSLNQMKSSSLWCEQCKEDGIGKQEKTILSLPQYLILIINQPFSETSLVLAFLLLIHILGMERRCFFFPFFFLNFIRSAISYSSKNS